MSLFAEVSNEVWLAAIAGVVTVMTILQTIVLALMQHLTKRSVEIGNAAAMVKREEAAANVEEVKSTLKEATKAADEKQDKMAQALEVVHKNTNSLVDKYGTVQRELGKVNGVVEERLRVESVQQDAKELTEKIQAEVAKAVESKTQPEKS